MQKHSPRRHNHSDFDLYSDIVKIKDAFSDTAKDARGRAAEILSESFSNAKKKTTDIQEVMTDYIAEKPIKSLGIAVLTGYLLATAMRLRRARHHRHH